MRRSTSILIALAIVAATSPTAALDLWVDHDSMGGACDDSRGRGDVSETAPWCTLAAAGSAVQPGDVVHVRGGTYSEVQTCGLCNDNAVLQIPISGTAAEPIRFEAVDGETVELTGAGGAQHGLAVIETYDDSVQPRFVTIDGFVIHDVPGNCVAVSDTSDVTLRNLDVYACGSGAVELHTTANVTLESSRIHDNLMGGWTSAVDLFECLDGNVVRGNYIWANTDEDPRDSEGHGITMDTCGAAGGALIENNVIWDNEGWCMTLFQGDGGTIRNNTCYQNGRRDGAGEISILGERYAVHNNVLVPRDGRLSLNIRERADYPVDYSTITADANLMWASTHDVVTGWADGNRGTVDEWRAGNPGGWGTAALGADPLFTDPGARDFRPMMGSPAIDSADEENAAGIDVDGFARPFDGDGDGAAASDRGAFEVGATMLGDAGPPLRRDGGTPVDSGTTRDSGTGSGDAGTSGGGDSDGCGCRVGADPRGAFGWFLLFAAVAFLHRRRASR